MRALKSVLFALLIPGTVTVVIPYVLISGRLSTVLHQWTPLQYAALLPMALGAAILVVCIRDLTVLGRGTLAHIDPPTRLVVRGLYRYVRNPMYLGGLMLLLSEAVAFRSIAIVAWAALWFLAINGVVVLYEEPVLQREFGEAYERYCKAVMRWRPGRPYDEHLPSAYR
jgi:protein-S-isoprenylcysteine O-methyltransferase Ste14